MTSITTLIQSNHLVFGSHPQVLENSQRFVHNLSSISCCDT